MLRALREASDGHTYVLFRWSHGGSSVAVIGSFNNWVRGSNTNPSTAKTKASTCTYFCGDCVVEQSEPVPMVLTTDAFGRGRLFNVRLLLPHGRHCFRFLVDGQEKYDPTIEYSVRFFDYIVALCCIIGISAAVLHVKLDRWTSQARSAT